jgi:DegV family protein with EDD domain
VDITPDEFYEMLAEAPEVPTTSQPSAGEFVEVYSQLSKDAEAIVSIHISDELSGTLQSARSAKELVSGMPIEIIDSRSISLGLGFVVLAAVQAAQEGRSLSEVVEVAQNLIPKTNILFIPDTLEYLHKGGRIGGAAALYGSMLKIKPVFDLAEGEIAPLERVRTKPKARQRMLDIMAERLEAEGSRAKLRAGVLHAASPDEAGALKEQVQSRFGPDECYLTELTPAVGTHSGPGTVGVGWYVE